MSYRIVIFILLFSLFGLIKVFQVKSAPPEVTEKGECQKTEFSSPAHKVNLIELFTSEGCSSCPPADRWISELYNHKELGKSFVALKYHVDYWNHLGWKDKYSSKQNTQRQRTYSQIWKARNIYTPAFVLNGEEWRVLGRRLPKKNKKKVGVLNVEIDKEKGMANVTFSHEDDKQVDFSPKIAILGNGEKYKIKAGENKGVSIQHHFAVIGVKSFLMSSQGSKVFKGSVKLPKVQLKSKEYSFAVWLETKEKMESIQAITGCLNKGIIVKEGDQG